MTDDNRETIIEEGARKLETTECVRCSGRGHLGDGLPCDHCQGRKRMTAQETAEAVARLVGVSMRLGLAGMSAARTRLRVEKLSGK